MKKTRLIAAILVASLILSSMSLQAAEEKRGPKQKAMQQFNESVARFKRCMRGNCTRWEALKAARDLGVVAAVVGGTVYAGKQFLASSQQLKALAEKFPVGSLVARKDSDGFVIGTVIKVQKDADGKWKVIMKPKFPRGLSEIDPLMIEVVDAPAE